MMRALSTRDRALKFYCLLIMAASIIERLLANTWYNRLRHRCSRVLRNLVNLAMEFKVRKKYHLVSTRCSNLVSMYTFILLYLSIFLFSKLWNKMGQGGKHWPRISSLIQIWIELSFKTLNRKPYT